MKPLTSKGNGQHFVFYLCIMFLAWSQVFELASADRVTDSFGSKNLRTGAEEIEVFKHVNMSSSTCPQDHSTSSGVAGGVEHSSETFWDELRQIVHHTQESLQVLTIGWSWHSDNCFNFLRVWFNTVCTQNMANIIDFIYSKMAFRLVSLKVTFTTVVQHLSKPHIMLLHIFPPHNKIIHNYLNTFSVLEQMKH